MHSDTWTVSISCVPPKKTHQQTVRVGRNPTTGKAMLYTTKGLGATWVSLLSPAAPPSPLEGPIALDVQITWPFNKSDGKKLRAAGRCPHWRRPDLDDMAKAILDAMTTTRWWSDDGQVAELLLRKYKGDKPGLAITARRMDHHG